MAQSGLPILADSRGIFEEIFVDIEMNNHRVKVRQLSSHMTNIVDILVAIIKTALVTR